MYKTLLVNLVEKVYCIFKLQFTVKGFSNLYGDIICAIKNVLAVTKKPIVYWIFYYYNLKNKKWYKYICFPLLTVKITKCLFCHLKLRFTCWHAMCLKYGYKHVCLCASNHNLLQNKVHKYWRIAKTKINSSHVNS